MPNAVVRFDDLQQPAEPTCGIVRPDKLADTRRVNVADAAQIHEDVARPVRQQRLDLGLHVTTERCAEFAGDANDRESNR